MTSDNNISLIQYHADKGFSLYILKYIISNWTDDLKENLIKIYPYIYFNYILHGQHIDSIVLNKNMFTRTEEHTWAKICKNYITDRFGGFNEKYNNILLKAETDAITLTENYMNDSFYNFDLNLSRPDYYYLPVITENIDVLKIHTEQYWRMAWFSRKPYHNDYIINILAYESFFKNTDYFMGRSEKELVNLFYYKNDVMKNRINGLSEEDKSKITKLASELLKVYSNPDNVDKLKLREINERYTNLSR